MEVQQTLVMRRPGARPVAVALEPQGQQTLSQTKMVTTESVMSGHQFDLLWLLGQHCPNPSGHH